MIETVNLCSINYYVVKTVEILVVSLVQICPVLIISMADSWLLSVFSAISLYKSIIPESVGSICADTDKYDATVIAINRYRIMDVWILQLFSSGLSLVVL